MRGEVHWQRAFGAHSENTMRCGDIRLAAMPRGEPMNPGSGQLFDKSPNIYIYSRVERFISHECAHMYRVYVVSGTT